MNYFEVPDQLVGVSQDQIVIPARGDVIDINVDPSQIDLLIRPESQVVLASQNSRANYFAGICVNWSVDVVAGTAVLRLEATQVGLAAAGTDGPWNVFIWSPPPRGLPYTQMNGLRVAVTGPSELTIPAGEIRSFFNGYTLKTSQNIVCDLTAEFGTGNGVQVKSAVLSGVLSNSGLSVTGGVDGAGHNTTFQSDFRFSASLGDLLDLTAQYQAAGNPLAGLFRPSIISVTRPTFLTVVTTPITAVASDTALTTADDINAAFSTYKRGGYSSSATACYYGLGLARKDSDGSIKAFSVAFAGASRMPDLPAGYSDFRLFTVYALKGGVLVTDTGDGFTYPYQPLRFVQSISASQVAETIYGNVQAAVTALNAVGIRAALRATVTATNLSGNVSAVNTTTDVITWSSNLRTQVGGNNNFTIIPARGGTWPTGATTRGLLYGHFVGSSNTDFTLHLDLANAKAGTSPINLTATGSNNGTGDTLALSNIGVNSGMDAECPIGGSGTYETAFGIALNFAALTDANHSDTLAIDGLVVSTNAYTGNTSLVPRPGSRTAATAVYRGSQNNIPVYSSVAIAPVQPNTWSNQGTTPFIFEFTAAR